MEPTPEQIAEWRRLVRDEDEDTAFIVGYVAQLAYAAGADAELEKCCEWVEKPTATGLPPERWKGLAVALRDHRRPRPSLKQQALEAMRGLYGVTEDAGESGRRIGVILRALESLPDSYPPA